MVKFSKANTKIKKLYRCRALAPWLRGRRRIFSLDLLSGWSCPYALHCSSRAVETKDGLRIEDGEHCKFRCFSASQEARLPLTYRKRKNNWLQLRTARTERGIYRILADDLPSSAGIVRFHVSGDFFSQAYFRAACLLAEHNPDVLFYAYTKALRFVIRTDRPANFVITASRGGVDDHLIARHGLRESVVVHTKAEAKRLGLPIDNDDSHAARPDRQFDSFALLIHGSQPAGSAAAKAVYRLTRSKRT